MKTFKDLFPLLALLAGVLGFVSCSDDNEDTVDEYADWQVKNENYWKDLYTATKSRIAQGDTTWKVIPYWAIDGLEPTHGTVQYGEMQHIIVHVLENGTGTDRAAFTDSVKVHYEGHLIPSPTYTAGYRFDIQSYHPQDQQSDGWFRHSRHEDAGRRPLDGLYSLHAGLRQDQADGIFHPRLLQLDFRPTNDRGVPIS